MKKFITLSLALFMIVSLLAGCGTETANLDFEIASKDELKPEVIGDYGKLKLPLDKKGTEITAIVSSEYTNHNDSVVINELRRRTGVNIQITAVPNSTFAQKAKVLMASQDTIPDIFQGFSNEEIFEFAQQGAFEAVSDHLDELPNFKDIFYDNPEKYGITKNSVKNYLGADGKLYQFLKYDCNRDVNHGFLYRKDIFDKHGLKMWTDEESFLNTLRELKKLYPSSTPYASKTGATIFRDFSYNWGMTKYLQYYDEETSQWKLTCTDPKYKKVLDLLKTMYDEGLIDPEFLTATQSAWTQKMTQNEKAFITWDWIGRMEMFETQTKDSNPEYDLRYARPINGKTIVLSKVIGGCAFKKSDKSVLAMKVNDYLISESGAELMTLGIEGVTYTIGEDGFADYIDLDNSVAVSTSELEEKYGLFIERFYRRFDRRSTYYNFTEREQEAQDLMNNMPGGGYWPEDPAPVLSKEEKEICAQYKASLEKAAEEFSTKYVLGTETGDAAWEKWVKKVETLGGNEIIKAYNDAQARYDAM